MNSYRRSGNTVQIPKLKENEIKELDTIDTQTISEISDGNRAAVVSSEEVVDHDGVELSINGSDLDLDYSDVEDEQTVDNGRGEPGEIVSSDEETTQNAPPPPPAKKKNFKSGDTGVKSFAKFQHLKDDSEFSDFIDIMLDKKLSQKKGDEPDRRASTKHRNKERGNLIKSPSDTTLYSPALRKANNIQANSQEQQIREFIRVNQLSNNLPDLAAPGVVQVNSNNPNESQGVNTVDNITNFVESIRISCDTSKNRSPQGKRSQDVRIVEAAVPVPSGSGSRRMNSGSGTDRTTDRTTDQLLLQAEKFKARVEAPKGRSNIDSLLMPYDYEQLRDKFVTEDGLGAIDKEILFLRNFDQDDEFFHVTSQIDPNLRTKIEKGEFIELERLLPRDRFSKGASDDLNKQLFQLISQGTNSYLTTPDHRNSNKINNIRKWDQAFRVFAAIYTQANPNRSGEIWQYVYVIHTAAYSNSWDSVAFYDTTFRQLMASKPWRSWGKTYTQGWNMAFNTNNAQFGYNNQSHNQSHGSSHNSGSKGQGQGQSRDWKDDCCWRFNKNKCKRTSSECRYDHRCTHCAGWYHSYNNCRKRTANKSYNGKNSNWTNYNTNTKASPAKVDSKDNKK